MFSQNHRMIVFSFVLCLFLSSISVSTNLAGYSIVTIDISQPSSVVWSDNFENGTKTLSEWAVYDRYIDGEEPITTNVTISNGLLYSSSYPNTSGINMLTHNSTTATGTWSVDVFPGEDFVFVMIFFMSPYWSSDYLGDPLGYILLIEPGQIRLGYWEPNPAGHLLMTLDSTSIPMTPGWRHIDITRQPDDMIYVYIDGVLWLQGKDSRHHSSEDFRLRTRGSTIFDNITVSDTIDIDRAPPYWTEPLINHIINEGDDFRYALHADDYAGIDTWWVNDIANFEVDDEGVISSVAPLPSGNYSVEVYVNDTLGNVLSGAFNIEVLPLPTNTTASTGPNLLDPYVITLYGAAGVAWVVAVTFIIRDYRKRKNALGNWTQV